MLKKILLSIGISSTLILSGCASTGSSGPKTDADGYPVLEVLSSTPYVWNDTISEALNVARMAQPARVGQGMRDFTDGTQAGVAGRSSTGERVAGGAIMGIGQGLFGVVASEMMISRVDQEMNWKPAIVELLPASKGSDFRFVQQYIASKIIDALQSQISDFELKAVVTPKHRQGLEQRSTIIVFDTDECAEALVFDSLNAELAPKRLSMGVIDNFLEGPIEFNGVCSIVFHLSFASTTVVDGVSHNIFVAEMVGDNAVAANYFNKFLMRGYEGYFILPDAYTFRGNDGTPGARKVFRAGFARVHKSGEMILFQRP